MTDILNHRLALTFAQIEDLAHLWRLQHDGGFLDKAEYRPNPNPNVPGMPPKIVAGYTYHAGEHRLFMREREPFLFWTDDDPMEFWIVVPDIGYFTFNRETGEQTGSAFRLRSINGWPRYLVDDDVGTRILVGKLTIPQAFGPNNWLDTAVRVESENEATREKYRKEMELKHRIAARDQELIAATFLQ